jgi:hypothetical protein
MLDWTRITWCERDWRHRKESAGFVWAGWGNDSEDELLLGSRSWLPVPQQIQSVQPINCGLPAAGISETGVLLLQCVVRFLMVEENTIQGCQKCLSRFIRTKASVVCSTTSIYCFSLMFFFLLFRCTQLHPKQIQRAKSLTKQDTPPILAWSTNSPSPINPWLFQARDRKISSKTTITSFSSSSSHVRDRGAD